MNKRKPWNPFPLASLKVMDVSSCAKIVLIYLAARSNWKGETCVGVRTIARELKKSTRYVMNGLKELRAKKYMTQSLRDRRDKEADWKILSQTILSGANTSPEQDADQVQILPPSGEANAPFQGEASSTEPYRSNKSPNLADANLTDEIEVSEKVSGAFNSSEENETETPTLVSEDKDKTNPEDDELEVLAWSEVRGAYVEEIDTVEELEACFPVFKHTTKPTLKDKRLMAEVIARLDGYAVLPSQCMEYARKHKQSTPGLIPRSPQGLWNAICDTVSATNSLAAQTKDHDPATCGLCVKELNAKPCDHCNGSTWNKPVVDHGRVYCQECMKLPTYRRESGRRGILTSSI